MQHQEFEPPESLRDFIKCFWYDTKDYGNEQSGFEVVPDGYAEIIFHFGSGCNIATQEGLRALPSPFMIGLLDKPIHFYAKNHLSIIGIRCFPWTVFDLLSLPSGKDGVRVFEHPVAGLHTVLSECINAGKIKDAIGHIIQYFLNIPSPISGNSMLLKAGTILRQANGTLQVRQVAAAAHATVRTLERNFKQSSGYTVKDVSGLMRFEQVRNRLWLHPNSNLAALALEMGYTDQSHLSKEFKRYSGTTPASFARKTKKGKQILQHDFVAFIQA